MKSSVTAQTVLIALRVSLLLIVGFDQFVNNCFDFAISFREKLLFSIRELYLCVSQKLRWKIYYFHESSISSQLKRYRKMRVMFRTEGVIIQITQNITNATRQIFCTLVKLFMLRDSPNDKIGVLRWDTFSFFSIYIEIAQ